MLEAYLALGGQSSVYIVQVIDTKGHFEPVQLFGSLVLKNFLQKYRCLAKFTYLSQVFVLFGCFVSVELFTVKLMHPGDNQQRVRHVAKIRNGKPESQIFDLLSMALRYVDAAVETDLLQYVVGQL